MKPVVIVNFKSYKESVGENALNLAKICDKVAKEKSAEIIVSVQAADIHAIVQAVSIPVFAQHVDTGYGSFTGSTNITSAKDAGACGTLLNHAEKKLDPTVLAKAAEECKALGLRTVICAANKEEVDIAIKLEPYAVAYEIPELIGGDTSITKAEPDLVKNFAKKMENSRSLALCGAGVKSGEDLKKAVELGTAGVLLASGITKAKDPEKALMDLLQNI